MIEGLARLFLNQMPAAAQKGQRLSDEEALRLAILEAFRGYGFTSPNPAVGCVILDKDNRFLSSGYHHRAGEKHAEAEALAALANPSGQLARRGDAWDLSSIPTENLKGAKVFVTLEPCAHEGRTPSCAKTLARLPLQEVTAILNDPFPQVAGKGLEILRAAGFRVRCLEAEGASPEPGGAGSGLVAAARAACEFFLTNTRVQRPFVSLKVATSLDGMMALQNGESQWITGQAARGFARALRGAHDACLVGRQTVLQDDPRLDARETPFTGLPRKLVILDSQGAVLQRPDLQIFKVHRPENVWVCTKAQASVSDSPLAQVLRFPSWDGGLWNELLNELWRRKIRSVWVEGGAQTLSSALGAGLADRLWLFQGPVLIGGRFGRPWTESWGAAQMSDRTEFADLHHMGFGQDQLTTGLLSKRKT